jgi:glycosyltransferase involved in cell wall biosynthesis
LRIGVDARELQGRPTGTGRYLRNLLRFWSESGRDELIAYFNGPPPADPVLRRPQLASRPLTAQPVRGLRWQQRLLPRAARRDGVDVLFSPAYGCPVVADVPRVTAVHDLSFFSVPEDFALREGAVRRALTAHSVRVSRAVAACSEFTRGEIQARFPAAAARVVYVPLGADDDLPAAPDRGAARRRLGVVGPLVLSVGSIFNRRRLPELLRAVARVAARRPELVLDVAGDNRTQPRRDLGALVASLGLERQVRLSGFVSEAGLVERYAAADLLVCLSDYEGFGLPAVEAMARGVPVVAADRPSLNEVAGDAALLVEPADVMAIAAAIERVLSSAPLRDELIAKGRAHAARFSWRRTAERTRSLLEAAAA